MTLITDSPVEPLTGHSDSPWKAASPDAKRFKEEPGMEIGATKRALFADSGWDSCPLKDSLSATCPPKTTDPADEIPIVPGPITTTAGDGDHAIPAAMQVTYDETGEAFKNLKQWMRPGPSAIRPTARERNAMIVDLIMAAFSEFNAAIYIYMFFRNG